MVPLRSAALTSMCGTILASVGRHWSLRSTEVTPDACEPWLHVNLGAQVLVLCGACYVLALWGTHLEKALAAHYNPFERPICGLIMTSNYGDSEEDILHTHRLERTSS